MVLKSILSVSFWGWLMNQLWVGVFLLGLFYETSMGFNFVGCFCKLSQGAFHFVGWFQDMHLAVASLLPCNCIEYYVIATITHMDPEQPPPITLCLTKPTQKLCKSLVVTIINMQLVVSSSVNVMEINDIV